MSNDNKTPKPAAQKQKVELDPRFIGRLTLTLFGISAVVALLLGIVNSATEPVIRKMQEEKTAAAMAQVLRAEEYVPLTVQEENVKGLYKAVTGGEQVGFVAEVTTSGFGGTISMVVGVDMTGCVTGVAVTSDKETANVGTKVTRDASVLKRFVGLGGTVIVNGGENRFDAISGATVTSKAVAAGVNTALAAVRANLG